MAKIVCLMGPTASGKTALAMRWQQELPFEIISVDSAMIYRGMDIGTAKPTVAELLQSPHHLIDILNPNESYSAANFCDDVQKIAKDIHSRGKIPLLVGGTMMYFHALQQGLSLLPESSPTVRDMLIQKGEQEGWSSLHEALSTIDPQSALRIKPQDKQRIIRALEVFHLSGQPLSKLQAIKKPITDMEFINIALFPENRAWLHQRIAKRFQIMLEQGLIAETEALIKKWQLNDQHASMRSVGYRQALVFLSGEIDEPMLLEKGIAATRQLAKRQLTWLRSWDKASRWDPQELDFKASFDWIQERVFS